MKLNENIDIERGDRLQIKCCSDCAADGVSLNHTINLHPVDHLDDFFYAHASGISLKRL